MLQAWPISWTSLVGIYYIKQECCKEWSVNIIYILQKEKYLSYKSAVLQGMTKFAEVKKWWKKIFCEQLFSEMQDELWTECKRKDDWTGKCVWVNQYMAGNEKLTEDCPEHILLKLLNSGTSHHNFDNMVFR